jgi:predicted HTH transcriptional regulator
MIDYLHLERYRENNRIEAKKATGGLPQSIWETYSAFANTEGGVILLGVTEREDKTLQALGLWDPLPLIQEFTALLEDPKVVSANLLGPDSLQILQVEGKNIIAIQVPPAPAALRPVYIGGDPLGGCYRRCGEGDYRCSPGEIGPPPEKCPERLPE